MPTQLDRTLQSRNLFFGFAGLVTAVSAWVIWGPSDIFPKQEPAGDPQYWTESQLRTYLSERGLVAEKMVTKDQLVARVRAVQSLPPTSGSPAS